MREVRPRRRTSKGDIMTAPTVAERLENIGQLLDAIVAALTPDTNESPAPVVTDIDGTATS